MKLSIPATANRKVLIASAAVAGVAVLTSTGFIAYQRDQAAEQATAAVAEALAACAGRVDPDLTDRLGKTVTGATGAFQGRQGGCNLHAADGTMVAAIQVTESLSGSVFEDMVKFRLDQGAEPGPEDLGTISAVGGPSSSNLAVVATEDDLFVRVDLFTDVDTDVAVDLTRTALGASLKGT